MSFRDKTVVITGGSSGIGQQIAIDFASEGANVIFTYKSNEEGAQKTYKKVSDICKEEWKQQIYYVKIDVSKENDVCYLFKFIEKACNRIPDILICNAGVSSVSVNDIVPITDTKLDTFNQILSTNVTGTFLCCREFIKCVSKESNNHVNRKIVIISSIRHEIIMWGDIAYNASKAAQTMMMKNMALEVSESGYNINVNCVAPGITLTGMYKEAQEDPIKKEQYGSNVPIGRMADTKDISSGVLYLSSNSANYVHGTTLTIDGGYSLRVGQK